MATPAHQPSWGLSSPYVQSTLVTFQPVPSRASVARLQCGSDVLSVTAPVIAACWTSAGSDRYSALSVSNGPPGFADRQCQRKSTSSPPAGPPWPREDAATPHVRLRPAGP